jgi:hypothetical protein
MVPPNAVAAAPVLPLPIMASASERVNLTQIPTATTSNARVEPKQAKSLAPWASTGASG